MSLDIDHGDPDPDTDDPEEITVRLEILGTGCAKCTKLEEVTRAAVRDLGLDDTEIVKVQDITSIMTYGVMTTPALAIDGNVVVSGRVPSQADVTSLITTALTARE